MKQKITINEPVFGSEIVFWIGYESAYFDNKFSKTFGVGISSTNSLADGCTRVYGKEAWIWMKEFQDIPKHKALLVHELTHAIHYILQVLGMHLSNETQETYAYFMGYAVKEFYDKLKTK